MHAKRFGRFAPIRQVARPFRDWSPKAKAVGEYRSVSCAVLYFVLLVVNLTFGASLVAESSSGCCVVS